MLPSRQVTANAYRSAMTADVWELSPPQIPGPLPGRATPRDLSDSAISRCAAECLHTPLDYPGIENAIIHGDHVALTADPSLPRVRAVLSGLIDSIARAGASQITVVLWEESDVSLANALNRDLNERLASDLVDAVAIEVVRHDSTDRTLLRYVAADDDALPVYLSRHLVDADLIIPVMAARRAHGWPSTVRHDITGVFPAFADAATIDRFGSSVQLPQTAEIENETDEVTNGAPDPLRENILGAPVIVLVSSDAAGDLRCIVCGTPRAIEGQLADYFGGKNFVGASDDTDDELASDDRSHASEPGPIEPMADLVLAALDGEAAVQTWPNVARAAIAASRHVHPDGVIVVWTRLATPCQPSWQRWLTSGGDDPEEAVDDAIDNAATESNEITDTDSGRRPASEGLVRQLAELRQRHAIWLHSDLPVADVEQLGLAVVDSIDELKRLGAGHHSAGVLRAAEFHGAMI